MDIIPHNRGEGRAASSSFPYFDEFCFTVKRRSRHSAPGQLFRPFQPAVWQGAKLNKSRNGLKLRNYHSSIKTTISNDIAKEPKTLRRLPNKWF